MGKQSDLEEAKRLWQQESDRYVLKAATEDIEEYPPEVRAIINEEAIRRGLLREPLVQSSTAPEEPQVICLDAPVGLRKACFCPMCKSIYVSPDLEKCFKCKVDLEQSGYCDKCNKFWPRCPGELCPNDQTKLAEKRLNLAEKAVRLIYWGIGFLLAYLLSEYFGSAIGIPFIGFLLCLWPTRKLLSPAKRPMLMAVAWQAGFVVSLTFVAILAGKFSGPVMAELLLTAGAVAWLIVWPGIASVVLLTVIHVLTLLAIALALALELEIGGIIPTYKSLLLNVILRVPAIIFMYTGLCAFHSRIKRFDESTISGDQSIG